MEQVTKVSARLSTTLNLGDFQNVKIEFGVEDWVRPGVDESTGAALDRVYQLVDAKLTKKAQEYK